MATSETTWAVEEAESELYKNNDADLGRISNLTELTELDISQNDITDSGLKHITNLTKLTMLNISETKITDAGIAYLVHLDNLKVLDLTNNYEMTFNFKINWSESPPKDHPIARLIAAGCFVYLDPDIEYW